MSSTLPAEAITCSVLGGARYWRSRSTFSARTRPDLRRRALLADVGVQAAPRVGSACAGRASAARRVGRRLDAVALGDP